MRKIQIWTILAVAAVVLVLTVIVFKLHYTEEDAWNELLALEPTVSMEDLSEKGFIDVSAVKNLPDPKIENFLKDAKNRQSCVLRITNVLDGKLCAKILLYNKEQDVIKMWTLYPKTQQGEAPGKCFGTEALVESGEVTAVILKNVPDISAPISAEEQEAYLTDEVLYSYRADV